VPTGQFTSHFGELSAARQHSSHAEMPQLSAQLETRHAGRLSRMHQHFAVVTSRAPHALPPRPGPSGYTADILRPLLDDAAGVEALRAELPTPAASALSLGRIASLREVFGASSSATFSGGWSRAPWHSNLLPHSRLPHTRASTPCPLVPAQKHSCIPCKSLVTATPRSPCSQSMGSVLLI